VQSSTLAIDAQTLERPVAEIPVMDVKSPEPATEQLLTKEKMSVWTGLVSKGISNALNGLSLMVGHQISVTGLDLRWLPIKEATGVVGGPEEEGIGIYLAIEGDATGHLLLMHDVSIAYKLIDIQLGIPLGETASMGEMERSVLGEMGNITGSYFLNALADTGDMVLMPSPPAVIVDMSRAIMNIPLSYIMEEQDDALMVKATFCVGNQPLDGSFMVLPTMDFMSTILARQTN